MDSFADCPLYMGLACFEKSETYSRAANSLWTPGSMPGDLQEYTNDYQVPVFYEYNLHRKMYKGVHF